MAGGRSLLQPTPDPLNPAGRYDCRSGKAAQYGKRWPPTVGAIGAASPARQNFADQEAKHFVYDNFNAEGASLSIAYVANTILDFGTWYEPNHPMLEGEVYDITFKMINFMRTAATVVDPVLETPYGFDSNGYFHPLKLHLRKVTTAFDIEASPKTAPFFPIDVLEIEELVQIPWAPDTSSFGKVAVTMRVLMPETIAKPVFSVSFENFHTPGSTIPNSAPTSALNILVGPEALGHNEGTDPLPGDFWAGDPVDPFGFFGEFGPTFDHLEPLLRIAKVFNPTCTGQCTAVPKSYRGPMGSPAVPSP